MAQLPKLNSLIHGKMRLAIVSILVGVEEAQFTFLREKTGATDGNLSAHLNKLEEAGYVISTKQFVSKKPMTTYRITLKGRQEFEKYVQNIKSMLGPGL